MIQEENCKTYTTLSVGKDLKVSAPPPAAEAAGLIEKETLALRSLTQGALNPKPEIQVSNKVNPLGHALSPWGRISTAVEQVLHPLGEKQ